MAVILALAGARAALAQAPEADCGGAIFRSAAIEANRNANVPLETYAHVQWRGFYAYENRLGRRFSSRFPTFSWLDIGSGYSVAALSAVADGLARSVVTVNAQDALAPMRARNYDWFRDHRGVDETLETSGFVRPDVSRFIFDERDRPKPNAIETMVNMGADQLALYEGLGRFQSLVGLAEDVLPQMRRRFQILTDLFGAYFYSARRPLLIREYYRRLAEDGEGLIVIRGRERLMNRGRPPDEITEFGPDNWIRRRNGRQQRFENYLVEAYPTIFSIENANADLPNARLRHALLVMRRDPRIDALDAFDGIEIESNAYGASGIARQIPSARYLER